MVYSVARDGDDPSDSIPWVLDGVSEDGRTLQLRHFVIRAPGVVVRTQPVVVERHDAVTIRLDQTLTGVEPGSRVGAYSSPVITEVKLQEPLGERTLRRAAVDDYLMSELVELRRAKRHHR